MTLVACTDKGQPEDIKDQINQLISTYISEPNTIILAVLAARPDLETDLALELIKKHDKKLCRTIGVLTKVDLLNKHINMKDYIENTVSIDLQMTLGYHIVRNRTQKECETISLQDGYKKESQFYASHPVYQHMIEGSSRFGVENVRQVCYSTLVEKINNEIPHIQNSIQTKLKDVSERLDVIGDSILSDKTQLHIQRSTSFIIGELHKALNQSVSYSNTNIRIKECFVQYRKSISELHPFNNKFGQPGKNISKRIQQICDQCEGNHMSFPSPKIEILEQCMKHEKPMLLFLEPSINCCNTICNELIILFEKIVSTSKYAQYPVFVKTINCIFTNIIILPLKVNTIQRINEIIKMQESYIWTDDEQFHMILHKQIETDHITTINNLCASYFTTVIKIIQDNIPKLIMYHLISKLKNSCENIFEELSQKTNLFEDTPEIEVERKNLKKKKNVLEKAIIIIKDI
tara:strand:+ start:1 stop:1386 length:1386 start_codon:yes stop_codon:yes gene_type:complete